MEHSFSLILFPLTILGIAGLSFLGYFLIIQAAKVLKQIQAWWKSEVQGAWNDFRATLDFRTKRKEELERFILDIRTLNDTVSDFLAKNSDSSAIVDLFMRGPSPEEMRVYRMQFRTQMQDLSDKLAVLQRIQLETELSLKSRLGLEEVKETKESQTYVFVEPQTSTASSSSSYTYTAPPKTETSSIKPNSLYSFECKKNDNQWHFSVLKGSELINLIGKIKGSGATYQDWIRNIREISS